MELRRGLLKEESCNLPDSTGTLNVKGDLFYGVNHIAIPPLFDA